MKKKGLIVATIVMVLVLAVSLTTATYAWFTAANTTIVEGIDFSVGSDTDVLIGVKQNYKKDDTYKTNVEAFTGSPTAAQFMWGDLGGEYTYDSATGASTWANGTAGLGHFINTGVTLASMKKAVGTSVDTSTTADAAWNAEHEIIVAEADASNDNVASTDNMALAKPQEDYLDIVFGVQAAKTDLIGINCIITVNPSETDLVLGMNAAIHVRWSFDGTTYYEADIYGATANQGPTGRVATYTGGKATNSYLSLIDSVGTSASDDYLGQGVSVNKGHAAIIIPIAVVDSGNLSTTDITQIHVQIFIAGYDLDCNNDALGVSSEILVNFEGVRAGA